MCSFRLCGSILANPVIFRIIPSPSRFETRQCIYIRHYLKNGIWYLKDTPNSLSIHELPEVATSQNNVEYSLYNSKYYQGCIDRIDLYNIAARSDECILGKSRCNVKALANELCCGHIVADTKVSPFARARNICCGHKFCVRDTKNVWFCSETFCVRNKCFPVCAAQETSWAIMCPQQCVLVYQDL